MARRRGRAGSVAYQNPWAVASRSPVADPVAAEFAPLVAGGVSPGGGVGWRPFPTYGAGTGPFGAPLQTGVFGDWLLNQFPAYYNQPQLHSAVEWQQSGYQSPTVGTLPYWLQTPRPVNLPGGQRFGLKFSGPLGPLTARTLQRRVAAAQVRQSGLQAMEWAQGLSSG